MPKRSIRADLLARRKHLAAETCLSHSLQIQQRLLQSAEFQSAAAVALYSPILNEVFTEQLFRAARIAGKLIAYPRVRGADLEFVQVAEAADLVPGSFGVLEPTGDQLLSPADLDMVVVPGVGFDRQGGRLGYGKGFYDRGLHCFRRPGYLVGLCFELQLLDKLPAENHDVHMDIIITEKGRYDLDSSSPSVSQFSSI
ncbi:5-formyltetrahydrofolate cyclo-ligase [Syntrophotalea acetylenivorans]|uniref:5-formyltetrahydrofolate cyclo-ligase n=1 Tax=Syntrophotalea acetylenivorans TaxID=1842532 RepID=A0A1L3GRU1_9BACT|nr:5-formyltetrahydrofolate cyclo-ligase [Syntrophotalea acetylenivorans]APG28643.1 5-formyltetrahydrofolate cyclo-ligase [Syntrophotalea acetylenivorans]